MTNPHPKFSILIPTRNGLRYLPYAVDSVLSQSFEDFELVISDNHSTDGTWDYLQTLNDSRVRTIQPPRPMSMVAHFEFIVGAARGEWITSLGDDDALMPFFFEAMKGIDLDRANVEALTFRRAYYYWDGCQELYGDSVISYSYLRTQRYRRSSFAMLKCVASVIDYMNLPQLYTTGLVKRSFVERIKTLGDGRFFFAENPDASSVVALASNSARYIRCEFPVFWTGTSNKSTGFSSGSSIAKERVADFDRLNLQDRLEVAPLPKELAVIFDITSIFYQTLISYPKVGKFWRSGFVYYIFLAGFAGKNREYDRIVRDLHASPLHRLKLSGAGLIVWLLRKIHRRTTKSERISEEAFNSDKRSEFSTIAEASRKAAAIWDGRLHNSTNDRAAA
jgi:glycosyltransferase involved in cell wall biosynthesis